MIVELIIKTDDRKIVSHVEWKGDVAHFGEAEMIINHDLRHAFQQTPWEALIKGLNPLTRERKFNAEK